MLMGDSTDGIQGIPKVGAKTADAWLQSPNSQQMPTFVLEKYIEKFGIHEGISKFGETFQLIYILKTKEEAMRTTGIELPELIVHSIQLKEDDLWQ
jgi:5'-3' exonuclease